MWFGVYYSMQSCRLTLDVQSEWNNQISESEVSERRSVRATKCPSEEMSERRNARDELSGDEVSDYNLNMSTNLPNYCSYIFHNYDIEPLKDLLPLVY